MRANLQRPQVKFVIASGVIILAVIYLAYSGYQESRMYCYSVPRVFALKDAALGNSFASGLRLISSSLRNGPMN